MWICNSMIERLQRNVVIQLAEKYIVGPKSFRPDKQKPRQMENVARDI
jgi:hypothetical protein